VKKIKLQVWSLLNALGLGGIVQLFLEGALKNYGWFRSYHTKQSVDAQGQPLPWYNYGFIFFLEPRLKPHFEVFEYGSGYSTRWYAQRVQAITAVEHDAAWVQQVAPQLPANAQVLFRSLTDGDNYTRAVAEAGRQYHIVIVDGRQRVECVRQAVGYLTPDGVLILDNSEREFYREAIELLKEKGFRQLEIRGMVPITSHDSCTSVFYRPGNCLDI
jgi:precorrin-6B methylase 2